MQKTYNNSYDIVFDTCKKALQKLNFKTTYQSKKDGIIGASTGTSIFSWGETIDIKVKTASAGKITVTVESSAKAQLFSWGKDDTNEKEVLDTLSDLL